MVIGFVAVHYLFSLLKTFWKRKWITLYLYDLFITSVSISCYWLSSFLWLTVSRSIWSNWVDFTHATSDVSSCQTIQSPLSNISLPSVDSGISSTVRWELYNFLCADRNHFNLTFFSPVLTSFTGKFCSSVSTRDLFFHSHLSH